MQRRIVGDHRGCLAGLLTSAPTALKQAVSVWLAVVLSSSLTESRGAEVLPPTNHVPAGSSSVVDLKGRAVEALAVGDARAVVLLFVRTDCPIANRYAPEIERLYRRFAPQHIAFWLVYPEDEAGEIRRHLREYHLSLKALRDPRHELVSRAKVSVTPEAAVFVADGREVYHGRIDDRYADFGKERPQATRHDLEEVLDAVVQGKPLPPDTKAVGCYISVPAHAPVHEGEEASGDGRGGMGQHQ